MLVSLPESWQEHCTLKRLFLQFSAEYCTIFLLLLSKGMFVFKIQGKFAKLCEGVTDFSFTLPGCMFSEELGGL